MLICNGCLCDVRVLEMDSIEGVLPLYRDDVNNNRNPVRRYDSLYTFELIPTPTPGENGHHFAEYIFRCFFVNQKFCILIWISLKFVPKDPIANNPTLL